MEMNLRNKTTLEFRTVLAVPWVSLIPRFHVLYYNYYYHLGKHLALQLHGIVSNIEMSETMKFINKTRACTKPSILNVGLHVVAYAGI